MSISDALISRDIDFHIVRPSIVGAAAAVYSSWTAAAAGPGRAVRSTCLARAAGVGQLSNHVTTKRRGWSGIFAGTHTHARARAQAHIRMVVNKAAGLYDKRTDIYSHIS